MVCAEKAGWVDSGISLSSELHLTTGILRGYCVTLSTLRFPIFLGAAMAITLAANAQQPAASSAPPASAPAPATSPAPATPAAAQSDQSATSRTQPSADTLKKAKSLGLHPETHSGVTKYCWEDANTGSRFATKKCADESQLDEIIAQREAAQDNMRRNMTGGGSK